MFNYRGGGFPYPEHLGTGEPENRFAERSQPFLRHTGVSAGLGLEPF
jgi:hypothetical protein